MRRGGDLVAPTRAEASLLVLNHNFNTGWRASTVAGAELAPVRVNGWQQGYVVPAGAGVTIREEFAPTGTYRLLLLVGLLGLVGLAGYAWARRRGRGRPGPPLPPRAGGRWPVSLLAAGLLVVLSGIWGVAALVVSELLLRTLRRGVPWVVLGASVAAGGLVAVRPWLAGGAAVDSAPAQALVVVAFALIVRRDSWRRPQRMMGRSRA
jgi:arabinofuranan 3-O-arabinosyltransferase